MLLLPTRKTIYHHDGICSGGDNDPVDALNDDPRAASIEINQRQCVLEGHRFFTVHIPPDACITDDLVLFARQCAQENDISPMDDFLSLITVPPQERVFDLNVNGCCSAAAPVHTPAYRDEYYHAVVFTLATEGERVLMSVPAEDLKWAPKFLELDSIDHYEIEDFYTVDDTGRVVVVPAFMKHVLSFLGGLRLHRIPKDIRKMLVLVYLQMISPFVW